MLNKQSDGLNDNDLEQLTQGKEMSSEVEDEDESEEVEEECWDGGYVGNVGTE